MQTETLAEELRLLLRARSDAPVTLDDYPCILHLFETASGGIDPTTTIRVANIQAILDDAIGTVADPEAQRALQHLLGTGELRYRSVKERGTRAAAETGIRYDAYRRRGTGRMMSDLLMLASALKDLHPPPAPAPAPAPDSAPVSQPATEPSPSPNNQTPATDRPLAATPDTAIPDTTIPHTASPEATSRDATNPAAATVETATSDATTSEPPARPNPGPDRRRVLLTAGLIATLLLGAFALRAVLPAADSAATDTAATNTAGDGQPCFEPGETDETSPEALAAAAAIQALAAAAPTATAPTATTPTAAPTATTPNSAACAVEPLTKRGPAYWQQLNQLDNPDALDGGYIAYQDPNGTTTAVRLAIGPWQSYIRIGAQDGSQSPEFGGFPTGEMTPIEDRWIMETTGDVLLIGESLDGTFYWMPDVVKAMWEADRAGDNLLGWPTSSIYLHDGGYRVDFERGQLRQGPDGAIEQTLIDIENPTTLDALTNRPTIDVVAGHLISGLDGTGWFIDDEGLRWWIPDGRTWECRGGGDNAVMSGMQGYEIHLLAYGGVADCP